MQQQILAAAGDGEGLVEIDRGRRVERGRSASRLRSA